MFMLFFVYMLNNTNFKHIYKRPSVCQAQAQDQDSKEKAS